MGVEAERLANAPTSLVAHKQSKCTLAPNTNARTQGEEYLTLWACLKRPVNSILESCNVGGLGHGEDFSGPKKLAQVHPNAREESKRGFGSLPPFSFLLRQSARSSVSAGTKGLDDLDNTVRREASLQTTDLLSRSPSNPRLQSVLNQAGTATPLQPKVPNTRQAPRTSVNNRAIINVDLVERHRGRPGAAASAVRLLTTWRPAWTHKDIISGPSGSP